MFVPWFLYSELCAFVWLQASSAHQWRGRGASLGTEKRGLRPFFFFVFLASFKTHGQQVGAQQIALLAPKAEKCSIHGNKDGVFLGLSTKLVDKISL